jgi:hypothetical protein
MVITSVDICYLILVNTSVVIVVVVYIPCQSSFMATFSAQPNDNVAQLLGNP